MKAAPAPNLQQCDFVAKASKIKPYTAQRRSSNKPLDPYNPPAVQEEFARRQPTAEDDYFFEKDHSVSNEKRRNLNKDPTSKISQAWTETQRTPVRSQTSLWRRFIQALLRSKDTGWRP